MRRLTVRPVLPAFLGLLCLLIALAACGGKSSSSPDTPQGGLSALSVSGSLGASPKVTFKDAVSVKSLDSKTVVTGTGATVAKGDSVLANVWVGDGYSKKQVYTSYDQGGAAPITAGDSGVPAGINIALTGHTIGSRVVVVAPPKDAFGTSGQTQLGIGNTDTVVFVIDLMGTVLTKPTGTAVTPPADAPVLVQKADVPTGFDFSKAPKKAPTKLESYTLIKGTGAQVKSGGSAVVNYLGEVYGGKKPFDFSYGKQAFPTKIGTGAVIKGWDKALVGVPVGSRVLLVIPPALAYGDKGQGEIPANSTLVFVVDVLATY